MTYVTLLEILETDKNRFSMVILEPVSALMDLLSVVMIGSRSFTLRALS